jgi:hypothetical protein
VLAALGSADDDEAGRKVLHSHRGLDLVDVLPALAAGAHGGDLEIGVFHLDVDLVFDIGGDLDGGEAGLPPRVAVERTDPNQAVHAHLCAQVAVSVGSGHGERRAVDSRFVARLVVDDVRAVAAALAPAQVHAQQDLRPVFGVGAAGAGMDADDGVRVIDRPRQHALELCLAHARVELDGLPFELRQGAIAFVGDELQQLERVVDVAAQALDELEFFLRLGPAPHVGLGPVLIVPEIRRARQRVELFDLAFQAIDVKETPLAHPCAF